MQRYRRTAILLLLALATIAVIAFGSKPSTKDFLSFWIAGQLIAHHQNPYDSNLVLASELRQGFSHAKPLIMRNPPWALPLVYPLGFASTRIALIAWMSATLAAVLLALHVFAVPPRDRIFAFLFAPVFACLASGQSSPYLLLGFLSFIVLRNQFPALAGASLVLLTIKPHLFLILLPVMMLDLVLKREYRAITGAAATFTAACACSTWLDHHVWIDYLRMLQTSSLDEEFLQTPAYLFRFLIAPKLVWLQLLPSALGLIWGIRYYLKRREQWDLKLHAAPLLFLSLLTSPYAWFTDEIMLLPMLLIVLTSRKRAPHIASLFLLVNTAALVLLFAQFQLSSGAYLWTSTAWAALYLYNQKNASAAHSDCKLADLQALTS